MQPDTIAARAIAETEIDADSADLQIVIEGSAVFSGTEAFKKAKELQELVVELGSCGIEESRIKLRNVRSTSQTFAMFKSSSARYSITIKSVATNQLSTILGRIAARKNAELVAINWNYSQLKETRVKLREQAAAEVKAQAIATAKILGVELLAVHTLTEANEAHPSKRRDWDDDEELIAHAAFAGISRKRAGAAAELAFSLANSKRVFVEIQAAFRVTAFQGTE